MPLHYSDTEKLVKKKLKGRVFESMLNYLKENKPVLWGAEQPSNFVRRMFVLAMYHSITGKGYQKITNSIENLGFKIWPRSVQVNSRRIRKALSGWGREQMPLGNITEWRKAMKHVAGVKHFPGLCLWMDSTDVKTENRKGKKKKEKNWSFKCNSRGRRYMVIVDGKGRIRKMWGGYSPKVYDGEFLKINQEWFENNLRGAGIIADQHFEAGKKLKGVKFFTKKRINDESSENESEIDENSSDVEIDSDMQDLAVNTKKEKGYNKALYRLRARVEQPFSEMRAIFAILQQHWRESDEALDEMMYMAMGVLNAKK